MKKMKIICLKCNKLVKTEKGIKIHITTMHKRKRKTRKRQIRYAVKRIKKSIPQLQIVYNQTLENKQSIEEQIEETKELMRNLEKEYMQMRISREEFRQKLIDYRQTLHMLELRKQKEEKNKNETQKTILQKTWEPISSSKKLLSTEPKTSMEKKTRIQLEEFLKKQVNGISNSKRMRELEERIIELLNVFGLESKEVSKVSYNGIEEMISRFEELSRLVNLVYSEISNRTPIKQKEEKILPGTVEQEKKQEAKQEQKTTAISKTEINQIRQKAIPIKQIEPEINQKTTAITKIETKKIEPEKHEFGSRGIEKGAPKTIKEIAIKQPAKAVQAYTITTDLDKLLDFVKSRKQTTISIASKELGIKQSLLENYAQTLEEGCLIRTSIPPIGSMKLFDIEPESKKKKEQEE